ncbi:hypothetical protein AURDEDRAFT_175781 [Auricularia subglabra TFB-10046 SS5]|uniref:MYND-type domain-containing protein n=1 Tax=Auricularia subglabra (strain TFB-10046 / SS5) TaxID=717982 RepID=J0WR53_AURST|nr:hypothetical protein AURDEDRAFT_175781 [Auricularia subglabra TFB-10046 SS5]
MLPPPRSLIFGPFPVGGRCVLVKIHLLDHLKNVLMPQLADPQKPTFCPICFQLYVGLLLLPDFKDALSHLLVDRHDFFDACIAFLVVQRAMFDLPALRKQLDKNKAHCATSDWHYFTRQLSDDSLATVLCAVFTFLTTGICNIKNKGWFRSKARKGTWPTAPEQLLPRGPLLSTAAYVFWCRALISPYAVPVLGGLLEVVRTDVLPHLLVSPQKDHLMEALIVMLSGDENVGSPALWERRVEGLLPQQTAASLIYVILNGHGARADEMAVLYSGHEHALYPALITLLDSDVVDDEQHLLAVATIATLVHGCLGHPKSTLHKRMLWYLSKLNLPEDVTVDVQIVFTILYHQARAKGCASFGCSGAGRQACGRCKFVQYCGRDCQREDWKNGREALEISVSHKMLCPVLCRLFDAGAQVEGKTIRQFIDTYRGAGVSDADTKVIISWGIAARLVPETMLREAFGIVSS